MCHHVRDATRERWNEPETTDEEDLERDEEPSFAQDEREVDVELLEADDD